MLYIKFQESPGFRPSEFSHNFGNPAAQPQSQSADSVTDSEWGFDDEPEAPSPYADMRGQYSLARQNPTLAKELDAISEAAATSSDIRANYDALGRIARAKADLLKKEKNLKYSTSTTLDQSKALHVQIGEVEDIDAQAKIAFAQKAGLGDLQGDWNAHLRVDAALREEARRVQMEKFKTELVDDAKAIEQRRVAMETAFQSKQNPAKDPLFNVEKGFFRRKTDVLLDKGAYLAHLAVKFPKNPIAKKFALEIERGKFNFESVSATVEAYVHDRAEHVTHGRGTRSIAAGLAGVGRITQADKEIAKQVVGNLNSGISPFAEQNIKQIAEAAIIHKCVESATTKVSPEQEPKRASLFERTLDKAKGMVDATRQSVSAKISSVIEGGKSAMETAQTNIAGVRDSVSKKVSTLFSGIGKKVGGWFSGGSPEPAFA